MQSTVAVEPRTLRLAAFPRAGVLTDAALIAGGAGLIALAAQVSIALPFTPVPITLQTMAVALVGAALGTVRGFVSMALYLALGIVGFHVFADGAYGWDVIVGATGGYLVGMLIAAAVVGALAERGWDRTLSSALGAMLTGSVIVYLVGLPWLANELGTGLEETLELGLYPFVPGDVFKLYAAAAALPLAWKLVKR